MVLRRLGLFAALSSTTLAAGLTGGETYAYTRRTSAQSNVARSTSSGLVQDGVSFTIGSGDDGKVFHSPTDATTFKSHTLTGNWGLEAVAGKTLPVTVFTVEGNVTCDTLGDMVVDYLSRDDVFDESFMTTILLQTSSSFHVDADVASCLADHWDGNLIIKSGDGTSQVSNIGLAHVSGDIVPNGPYIASIGKDITLTEVYRVFRDQSQAFTTGAIKTLDDTFVAHSASFPGMNTLSIPVPSRLYADVPNPRPLEGVRIAVKDIYDMAGLRTACGNRAYFLTYPEREVNAVAVQRLIDQGAVLVGRSKTSSFANGESPTADWVDQLDAFNPRGDEWQSTSSSSAGSGAAIAAYDWLDVTLGTDTGGSVRGPASAQGTYGLRPSHGAVDLTNIMPMASVLDTAGFLTRDAELANRFGKAWYGGQFSNYSDWPKNVIVPNDFWTFLDSSLAAPILNKFASDVTSFLNATSTRQGYNELWNSTDAITSVGNGEVLDTFMYYVYSHLITYDQWTNFGKPWFDDYAATHDGRKPALGPSPEIRWGYAQNNLTVANYTEAVRRKEVFKTFVEDNLLATDAETCSNSIVLMPWSVGRTNYRNVYRTAPGPSLGWSFWYYSVMAETPEIVVPLGQVPYNSTVTGHVEYLPVTASIMAAKGCDYVVLDIVRALQTAGIIKEYKVGSSME